MRGFALIGVLALAGCAASGPAPKSVGVTVGKSPITIAAPRSLCVDQSSLRQNRSGAFALLDECAALGPVRRGVVPPPGNGLVTVSVSPGPIARGSESQTVGLESLRAFLKGPGLPALSRSGDVAKVSIDRSFIEDDMLFIRVKDTGAVPVPGLSSLFWRGFLEARGQTVGAAVSTFRSSGGGSSEALLRDVLREMRRANPPVKNPVSTALTTLGKLNPLGGLLKQETPIVQTLPKSSE